MRTKIVGRESELASLRTRFESSKSELVVIYGRRRVGKSAIIHQFLQSLNSSPKSTALVSAKSNRARTLAFEALEGQGTPDQLTHFSGRLKQQIPHALPKNARFESWDEAFDFLTLYISQQDAKTVIVFDEFQWMAAGQSKLVALIKYYWDNHWKNQKVMLILCGSIASFMVKKVLRSKALYGRFSLQMQIRKLTASAALEMFRGKIPKLEILKYLIVFGGVPKYLEEIDLKRSFEQNLEELFFSDNALYLDEFAKIFDVHFKAPRTYLKIIQTLNNRTLGLEEISKALKMRSSGGVRAYLENLELSEFIRPYHTFLNGDSRYVRYKLSDEFTNFYRRFVAPNRGVIANGGGRHLFRNKILKQLQPWLGLAFESYIINNALYVAERLGFADKVESFGPYYRKGESGIQVDLIYYRSDDTISVCEMKLQSAPISTEVIPAFEAKLKRLPPLKKSVRIHKVLIAANGISEALRVADYFDTVATADALF